MALMYTLNIWIIILNINLNGIICYDLLLVLPFNCWEDNKNLTFSVNITTTHALKRVRKEDRFIKYFDNCNDNLFNNLERIGELNFQNQPTIMIHNDYDDCETFERFQRWKKDELRISSICDLIPKSQQIFHLLNAIFYKFQWKYVTIISTLNSPYSIQSKNLFIELNKGGYIVEQFLLVSLNNYEQVADSLENVRSNGK